MSTTEAALATDQQQAPTEWIPRFYERSYLPDLKPVLAYCEAGPRREEDRDENEYGIKLLKLAIRLQEIAEATWWEPGISSGRRLPFCDEKVRAKVRQIGAEAARIDGIDAMREVCHMAFTERREREDPAYSVFEQNRFIPSAICGSAMDGLNIAWSGIGGWWA